VTFTLIGIFFIYIGILDVIFEELLDPKMWGEIRNLGSEFVSYANIIVRVLGYTMLSFGLIISGISIKSYRNGEKWAWALFWIVPCFLLVVSYTVLTNGGIVWIIEAIVLILALIAQVFMYFFSIRQVNRLKG